MPECYFCGTVLRWSSDFVFGDTGIDGGGGVVATFECPGCQATAQFTSKIECESEDIDDYSNYEEDDNN